MALFGAGKRYLGIDIGTASLKAVELENAGGKARLVTYGLIQLPHDLIRGDSEKVTQSIAESLRQIVLKANVSSKRVYTALPSFSIFTSMLEFPQMSTQELERAIRFEAEKFVPDALSEMVLDYEHVGADPAKKKIKVLVTAAPKRMVNRYTKIFALAGLRLESVETESFALVRSLIGFDTAPTLLIDIGATATDLIIVDGGKPLLDRNIDFGGNAITHTIANSLNINIERAEQFKKDFGLLETQVQNQVPKAIKSVMDTILREIHQTFNLFYQKGGRRIEKIIITGGGAKLPHLDVFLSTFLRTPVYQGNPWARVMFPRELEPILHEIGSDFAVAIGLAMRGIYS